MKTATFIESKLRTELKGDIFIWILISLLVAASLVAVSSSIETLAYRERGGDTSYYILKQMIHLGLGLIVVFVVHLIDYRRFSGIARYLFYASIPLLIYTLIWGPEINDAKRWVEIPGIGISIQTSDFAKLALILYLARAITIKQEHIKDFYQAFLPLIAPVLLVCALIAPSDLSNACILFVTCLAMMFVGRVELKYIAVLILMGIFVLTFIIGIGYVVPGVTRVDTWVSRINEFLYSDGGYQILQSKIAIAEGGVFGVGPGQSSQNTLLPYMYADFIYAIICEEYGLVGGISVITIYALLFVRCVKLVTVSSKTFGSLCVLGLGMSVVLQAFANIAVSVQLVPVTGLTMPLVSMGGTSILFTCVSLGIILSVSRIIRASSIVEPLNTAQS